MTTPFHGRFPEDTRYLGYLLDNIDAYFGQPENLLTVLRESTIAVVQGIFNDAAAVSTVTNFLATLPGGATPIDNETIIQYCNQLVVLLDDVDHANQGIEEEDPLAKDMQIQQRLQETESQLIALLSQAADLLNQIPADLNGTGLHDYLMQALQMGGCNNVFASNARLVVEPLARNGYLPIAAQIRNCLSEDFGVIV